MKTLKWPTKKEESDYMRMRQAQNRASCATNVNENWMRDLLHARTVWAWTRQAQWGYRLFDFFSHTLGVAIEVDGPEHNKVVDAYRDEYVFRRSGIIVLRVGNRNEEEALRVIATLMQCDTWKKRRAWRRLGKGNSKKMRRRYLKRPYPPSLLKQEIIDLAAKIPG